MSTSTYIYIFGESETKIWGLTGRERLQRMLKAKEHITLIDNVEKIPVSATALFLNANFLFDARVLTALLDIDKKIALYSDDNCPAAIRTDGSQAPQLLRNLNDNKSQNYKFVLLIVPRISLKDLEIDFQQNLKKKDPPYILPISETNRLLLEKELFSGSYKGVTDLVTKWLAAAGILVHPLLCTPWLATQSRYLPQRRFCPTGRGCILVWIFWYGSAHGMVHDLSRYR